MKSIAPFLLASVAAPLVLVAAACGSKPPPPPPVVETAHTVEPPKPPPPKPPPKCEALDEACVGAAGTKARIQSSGLAFEPPAGWTYAQMDDGTIATSAGKDSAMAVAVFDVPDKK